MSNPDGEKPKEADKKKDLGPPLKILVADDTAVNLALATKLLKRRGHDIIAVEMASKLLKLSRKPPLMLS